MSVPMDLSDIIVLIVLCFSQFLLRKIDL